MLLRLLGSNMPAVILEIGTWTGGTAWAFSQMRSVTRLLTVDVDPKAEAAPRLASLRCRADQVIGDSSQTATRDTVVRALGGTMPDIVFIDGAHDYAHARADWDLYSPLVEGGGLIVLHDTQGYPGNPTVEVPKLWAELRENYLCTEIVDIPGGPGGTGIVWT